MGLGVRFGVGAGGNRVFKIPGFNFSAWFATNKPNMANKPILTAPINALSKRSNPWLLFCARSFLFAAAKRARKRGVGILFTLQLGLIQWKYYILVK
jgi:hypothetical protein